MLLRRGSGRGVSLGFWMWAGLDGCVVGSVGGGKESAALIDEPAGS
jgi:hypothetical protein